MPNIHNFQTTFIQAHKAKSKQMNLHAIRNLGRQSEPGLEVRDTMTYSKDQALSQVRALGLVLGTTGLLAIGASAVAVSTGLAFIGLAGGVAGFGGAYACDRLMGNGFTSAG